MQKKELSISNVKRIASLSIYFVVPLFAASLTVIKALYMPGEGAFDASDDDGLTFPRLFAAKHLLLNGELPLINLYENFGTPLFGDGLTFPFAPHSITYYFFDSLNAMFYNRFIIAFLTVLLLTRYYRAFFSPVIASLLSIVCFWTPSFFYHFAHHHFQMSILTLVLALFARRKFEEKPSALSYLLFFFSLVLMLNSVSPNICFFSIPIIFLDYLLSIKKIDSHNISLTISIILAVLSSVIFTLPSLIYTYLLMQNSSRLDYLFSQNITPWEVIDSAIGQLIRPEVGHGHGFTWTHHIKAVVYVSLPVLMLLAIGVRQIIRSSQINYVTKRSAILLGFIPFCLVYLLLLVHPLWSAIPVIRSTDPTRILWVTNIFLGIILGCGISAFSEKKPMNIYLMIFFMISTLFFILNDYLHIYYKAPVILFFSALIIRYYAEHKNQRLFHLASGMAGLSLAAALFVSSWFLLGMDGIYSVRQGNYFSPLSWYGKKLPQLELINQTESNARIASLPNSNHNFAQRSFSRYSEDLRTVYVFRTSVNSISTFLHKGLMEHLNGKGLINIDGSPPTYHIKFGADSITLASVGIQYLLIDSSDSYSSDWQVIGETSGRKLIKNPIDVGLARIGDTFIEAEISLNSLNVLLPEICSPDTLTLLFTAWPGWKAYVDGNERSIEKGEDPFLHLIIQPGDKNVRMIFQPVTILHLGFAGAFSMLVMMLGFIFNMKFR